MTFGGCPSIPGSPCSVARSGHDRPLRAALHALPTKAARELRALVQPLDDLYLAHSLPERATAHIRALLADTPEQPLPVDTFTFAIDAVFAGWLVVIVGDQRGDTRLHASDLMPALDDLLAALVALTAGERHARVS